MRQLNQLQPIDTSKLESLLLAESMRVDLLNWDKTKRRWARSLGRLPRSSEIREVYCNLKEATTFNHSQEAVEKSLRVKKRRSLSGVVPIALMMKPHPCPGRCTYCVQEPGLPKSYMSDEPSALRALSHDFDVKAQLIERLKQLEATGHKPEKLQIIVIGGTFSSYPEIYKKAFLKAIFDSANGVESPDIVTAQQVNENAKYRIIGLSIETRPDWVSTSEIRLLREYGVTKVQLGVQALDDQILKNIRRGHTLEAVKQATLLLRNAGFKINYHFMPNLPGSSPKKDIEMCREMFENPAFKPDTLKIYPCIVIPKTALWRQWKQGEHKPYNDETLAKVAAECKKLVPYYCRIDRLVRDISSKFTAAGTRKTNFRQHIEKYLLNNKIKCECIRCREVKDGKINCEQPPSLQVKHYDTLGGKEYFIAYEDASHLYAMLRLRLPSSSTVGMIRELQVFGKQLPLTSPNDRATQHESFGKKLLFEAEKICTEHGYEILKIISGVGVRGYYKKLGYRLEDTYMLKEILAST